MATSLTSRLVNGGRPGALPPNPYCLGTNGVYSREACSADAIHA